MISIQKHSGTYIVVVLLCVSLFVENYEVYQVYIELNFLVRTQRRTPVHLHTCTHTKLFQRRFKAHTALKQFFVRTGASPC